MASVAPSHISEKLVSKFVTPSHRNLPRKSQQESGFYRRTDGRRKEAVAEENLKAEENAGNKVMKSHGGPSLFRKGVSNKRRENAQDKSLCSQNQLSNLNC